MSYVSRDTVKENVSKAVDGVPQNPVVLVGALILTGIAALMILAGEDTRAFRTHLTESGTKVYPTGVFRAPHPAIFAPGVAVPED